MESNRREFLKIMSAIGMSAIAFHNFNCAKRSPQKNVLFINVDDLRPQMGCYANSLPLHGQQMIKTPHMDSIADDGVLFERAYCAVPVCAASRLSMLTGSRPYKEPGNLWGRHWAYYSRLDHEIRSEPAGMNHPGNSITMPQHFKNNRLRSLEKAAKQTIPIQLGVVLGAGRSRCAFFYRGSHGG